MPFTVALSQSAAQFATQSAAQAKSIAFIDRSLHDYEMLAAGVLPNVGVILLDPAEDGVRQISQVLAEHRGLSSIHLVSHGAPGKVLLGNAELSQETLDRYANDLEVWASALAPAAELLIYGCEVAKGNRGRALIDQLSELTGAAVAASTTKTGCADLGGNWDLDVRTGKTIVTLALKPKAIADYAFVLADGDLDTSFGTNGKVIHSLSIYSDVGRKVLVLPDGKIVVAGYAYNVSNSSFDFALTRYNANGSLDTTFGTSGRVITPVGSNDDQGFSAVLQPDGKIIVAGYANGGFAMTRYNANGSLDTTFGTGGRVITPFSNSSGQAFSVALQPDGKIVLAGSAWNSSNNEDFALVRYNTNGSLDTTFGTGGQVITPIGLDRDVASSVVIQSDGKIIAAGYAFDVSTFQYRFALTRYNTNGSLDTSFGNGGKVFTASGSTGVASSVILQTDGKILVAGSDYGYATLARYNTNGSLDNSFGNSGIATLTEYSYTSPLESVVLQADGKIVVAGSAIGSNSDFLLMRYNTNGSLDASFGNGGKVITPVSSTDDSGYSVALQPDGKILVAGTANGDFAIVRYQATTSTRISITPGTNPIEGGVSSTYTITLETPAPAGGLSVNFTTTGTATRTTDYTLTAGTNITGLTDSTFTIAAGATTATIRIAAVADGNLVDPNETVTLNLTAGTGYAVGNSSSATVTIIDNRPPSITSSTTATVPENFTGTVYTATATDSDAGTTLSYNLSGVDAPLFRINSSTGVVTFNGAFSPNFESPSDNGANNVYNITVNASDGSLTASRGVAITVTDINDAPRITSGGTASFLEGGTGTAYTVIATDEDAGTTLNYSLSGADAALFSIDRTGAVTFKTAPSFQTPLDSGANNVYDINVIASDGILSASKAVAITVTPVNNGPRVTITPGTNPTEGGANGTYTITLDNPAPAGGLVVNFTTEGTATRNTDYALVAGTNIAAISNNTLTIAAGATTATLRVAANADAPVENNETVTVSLQTGTGYVLGTTVNATLTIVDTSPLPKVSIAPGNNPREGEAIGTFTITLDTPAPTGLFISFTAGGTATRTTDYIFGSGPNKGQDISYISIDPGATTATLYVFAEADSIVEPNETITVNLASGTGYTLGSTSTATVTLIDNQPPTIVSADTATVPENFAGVVYTAIATDPNPGTTLFYSLSGADADRFNINSSTGAVTLRNASGSADFETPIDSDRNNVYNINVIASDNSLSTSKAVAITVTNVNEAPTVTSPSAVTFAENDAAIAYTVTATDPDSGTALTYSLSGTDSDRFNIDAITGAISFKAVPNFEAPIDSDRNNVYNINVTASDGSLSASKAVAVTVTDVNEAPAITSPASVNFIEDGTGAAYSVTATDPDAATTLTYSLSGTDVDRFTINANTGIVTFKTPPNFEAPADSDRNNTYSISVTANDGLLSVTKAVTITVVNGNEAPIVTSPAAVSVAENGTDAAYRVTATDPDEGSTLKYAITGTDAELFVVDQNTGIIMFANAPDFENPGDSNADNVYDITVLAMDGVLSASKPVTITVLNANEAPAITSSDSANFTENRTGVVYTATATDPDEGSILSYQLSGDDANLFDIDSSTGVITFKAIPNFDTPADRDANNIYNINVIASDGTLTDTKAVAITVILGDRPPVITSSETANFAENSTGTAYTVTASDPNANTQLTYSLSGIDAALFDIDRNTGAVTFKTAPNFEVPGDSGANNIYDINVIASDGALNTSKAVTIAVTNVNEQPAVNGTIAAQTAIPGSLLTFAIPPNTFSDPDNGTVLTYAATLSDGTALPAWLTFDAATRTFSGTPAASDVGTLSVKVIATDEGGLSATSALNISIASPGNLDPTFGNGGKVVTDFGNSYDSANSVVLQNDGKIVVAGRTYNYSTNSYDFALTRYNSNGILDTSFGNGGKVVTDFGNSHDSANSIVLQNDGKIVVAGFSNDNFALTRYNSNGILDTSFGNGGKVVTDFGNSYDSANSVVLQNDGKIVVAGRTYNYSTNSYDFALTRYNSNGILDTSFGNGGKVVTDFGNSYDLANSVVLQNDGKVVVAGRTYDYSTGNYGFALTRYNPSGNLDPTFGNGGRVVTDFGSSDDYANSVVLQNDGKIVVAGISNGDFALTRYNPNGILDTSFGNGGRVVTDLGNSYDLANSVVLQNDGKIVVAGISNGDFALTRYNSNGSLDATFGNRGKLTTDLAGGSYDEGYDVALQSDGKIVVAGISNGNFALVRYLGTQSSSVAQTQGNVQDGPIAGATLFFDANQNGVQDAGEPFTITDASGNFEITISANFDSNGNGTIDPEEGRYVATGGIDTLIGKSFTSTLKALPGSTVVTPLTTLVSNLVTADSTPEAAQNQVKTALGLPDNIDLSTFDPIEAAQAGSANGQKVLAAQVAVQTVISQIASSIQAVTPTVNAQTVENAISNALSNQIQQGSLLNFADTEQVQSLLGSTVNTLAAQDNTLNLQTISDNAAQISQVIAASGQVLLNASNATDLFKAQKVAQGNTTEELTAALQNNQSLDTVVANNTGTVLTDRINAATIASTALATADNFPTSRDKIFSGNVLSNDSSIGGGTLAVTAVNGNSASVGQTIALSSGALLTLNANGTFVYDPNQKFDNLTAGATASDFFTYTIASGNATDTATAVLTIRANAAPTAVVLSNAVGSIAENTSNVKVADIEITDDDFGTNTLSLSGADAASFEIRDIAGDGKALFFIGSGDFESAKTRYSVIVSATDSTITGSVPVSQTLTLDITDVNEIPTDTTPPDAPTIALTTDSSIVADGITNDANVSVTGIEPDAIVEYQIGNGEWSPSYSVPTADGSYTVRVRQTDQAGNVSSAGTTAFILDKTAPTAPTLAAIAEDNTVNAVETAAGVVLSGSTESGSSVSLTIANQTRNAAVNGTAWSYTLTDADITALGQGTGKTVTITSTDLAGNSTSVPSPAFTIDTVAPIAAISTIGGSDNTASSIAGDAQVVGTTEANSIVTVKFGSAVLGNAIADASGNWAYTLTSADLQTIGQGSGKTLTATASDAAGNASSTSASRTFAVDTIAPNAPSIADVRDNTGSIQGSVASGGMTNDTTPTFVINLAGTGAVAGNTVRLWNGSIQIAALTLSSSHIAAGNVSVTPSTLAQGNYSVTASITDAAGNQSAASAARTFTLDTATPTPIIATVAGDNRVNRAEKSAGVTVSGTAEANSSVSVTWGSTVQDTTADASGNWSQYFTPEQISADGTSSLSVRAVDRAGNTSRTATRSISIDTVAPTATANGISSLRNDTGSSNSDFLTNAATQTVTGTFTGTLGTGESIQVSANGTTWATATLNTTTSTWTANVTLQPGTNTLLTRTIDAAGNFISGTSRAYTLDQTAPAVSIAIAALSSDAGPSSSDFITNVASQTVSGTFTGTLGDSELIQVSTNGTTWVTATPDGSNWTAGVSLLSSANRRILTRTIDAAGNVTPGASQAYILDTTAPTTPTVTGYSATSVSGTTEANAAILLSTSASSPTLFAATTLANASGRYTIDLSGLSGAAAGTTYYLYGQDLAGNLSSANSRRVVVGTGENDILTNVGTGASDLLVGGEGTIDTARYAVSSNAIAQTGRISSAIGSVNISTANIDVLTGIEQIQFTAAGYTSMTAGTTPGNNQLRSTVQSVLSNNSIAAFVGTYDASSGSFTFGEGAGANSTLIAYDSNVGSTTNYEAFLLLGKTTTSGSIQLTGGTVTLNGF